MAAATPFAMAPAEALKWFREKGYATTFDHRDMWGQQHARAFTVAKAMQLDVLADLRVALDDALRKGQTLGEFRKNLKPTLQAKGWWGEKEMIDPKTGEAKLVQLGSARRLRTIYQTNMRQAQAAGRWERFERTKAARPYGRYVALLDGNERAEHRKWHGIILPLDDPWWETHAPPNGWGCRCKMQQLSERDLKRFGFEVTKAAPEDVMKVYKNERTGEVTKVPAGIDPGFEHNPGAEARGYVPGDKELSAPALADSKTFRDLGLPTAAELLARGDLPEAVPRWHDIKSVADADAKYVELFGTGKPVDVTDPDGMQVTFTPKILEHLIGRQGQRQGLQRAESLPRAKQAIEQPTEIWLVPHRLANPKDPNAGQVVLRKVYVGIFRDRGLSYAMVAQRTDEGFAAWTMYPTNEIDKKRAGYLLWTRPK